MFRYYFFINMTIYFYVTFVLALFLILIHLGLAPHLPYLEKLTNFECGYHSFVGQNRLQFFVSFFVFGLVYLLFDLEISLLYPYSVSSYLNGPARWCGKSSVVGFRLSNSGKPHKIEREMDNRGSKSSVNDANSSSISLVKEQRLDGSRHLLPLQKMGCLRCGLMGLEINYKVKIPAKQINKVRSHSTLRVNQIQESIINPWFLRVFRWWITFCASNQ